MMTADPADRHRRRAFHGSASEYPADPWRVPRPAVISFSGGRTSGYMLKHILDAHSGRFPYDVAVIFANTGLERPETGVVRANRLEPPGEVP